MKQIISLMVVVAISAFAAPDRTGTAGADDVTVIGKLIDTKCYGMNHANAGNDHVAPGKDGAMMTVPQCATACAALGIPVGILEGGKADGKVYVLVTPAGALSKHQAKEARVTGAAVYAGSILPNKVEFKEDGKWVDVTPAGMM